MTATLRTEDAKRRPVIIGESFANLAAYDSPTKRRSWTAHSCIDMKSLLILSLACSMMAGCAPNSDPTDANSKLAEANKKIATLEARLEKANAGSTQASGPASMPAQEQPASVSLLEPKDVPVGLQWNYEQREDPMSGGKSYTASVQSSNTVSFGFPYTGDQHATLTLRNTQGKSKDVMFYIEKGQILCSSYDGCSVLVRFDDEKPMRFGANGPADHSSELIFLEGYSKFMAKVKTAKRVRISVNIYQNGAPAFEFDVSGFDHERYVSTS